MHIRNYLKVLIDRSLVLGTVDRPQLHDVMLDYVQKELAGDQYKASQRRLVDAFRKADRSSMSATGKYMQLCIKHHITEAYDEVWGTSPQAMSWLEDHVKGEQDFIATTTACVLPDVQALAKGAEDAKLWWSAALRWTAFAAAKMVELGSFSVSLEFLERAVKAAENIAMSTDGNGSVGVSCTQFDLDGFNLIVMSKMMLTFDPALIAAYAERISKLTATEAGKSRPVLLVRIALILEWFPALLSGNPDTMAAMNWKLTNKLMDMSDESTDVYSRLTDNEHYLIKPCALTYTFLGGDAMMRTPGFTLDMYGPNGDKLLEWAKAYNYQEHHRYIAEVISTDCWSGVNGADWLLTLQYGRVRDALPILEKRLRLLPNVIADTSSPSRSFDIAITTTNLLVCLHVHGQPTMIRKLIEILGITLDSVSDYLSDLLKDNMIYSLMEDKGPNPRLCPLKRLCWQIQSFLVMHADVPASKAIAWLEALPDDEGFYQYSMTQPTYDHGALWGGNHQTCWIALAHEKVGLYDGALRFCRLALEPDLLKAGTPYIKWAFTIASACKGRVLTKLNRHIEALDAFQTAITISKESYSMMEALAYRELATYNGVPVPAAMVAAVAQAGRDMETKLKEFDGRLTRAEFDMLSIAPP
jgi:tetratricopeptide (TPR) repeat protein